MIALLLFVGLYLGLLILVIVLAVNAKTTAGRVGSILTGLLLLFVVPMVLVAILYTVRSESLQEANVVRQGDMDSSYQEAVVKIDERSANEMHSESSAATAFAPALPSPALESPTPASPVPPPVMQPVGDHPPGVWRTTDTETFSANVFPSYAAATQPMMNSLREKLIDNEVLVRDENNELIDPDSIVVTAIGSNIEPLVSQIVDRISKQFPGAVVRSAGNTAPEPAENQLSVHFVVSDVTKQVAAWDRQEQNEQANLVCTVTANEKQTSFQSFVTEKPWVESFDRFVSMYPQRNFVIGYSGELHSSEGQARKDALTDAARQAAITFRGQAYATIDQRHVIDRFAQRLSRSYGDVWREAILVELPHPDQVSVAHATVATTFQRSTMGNLMRHIGIFVLILVTIVLCLALNWVSKGYYRTQVLLGLSGLVIMGFYLAIRFNS